MHSIKKNTDYIKSKIKFLILKTSSHKELKVMSQGGHFWIPASMNINLQHPIKMRMNDSKQKVRAQLSLRGWMPE